MYIVSCMVSVCESSAILACVSTSVEEISASISITNADSDLQIVSTQICR